MTAPEVPATNDPLPYVWPEHLRKYPNGEPLRSMFSHGDGHALIFDPRPEFDAEVPADEGTHFFYDEDIHTDGSGASLRSETKAGKRRAEHQSWCITQASCNCAPKKNKP